MEILVLDMEEVHIEYDESQFESLNKLFHGYSSTNHPQNADQKL